MNTYLIVKTLHIISATLMVGTGFGTAFYLFWANRSGSVAAQSVVSHWVIKADWWFTTPAVIFQPLSGLWMLYERGYTVTTMLEQNWIWMTLALYIFSGICWLPVVWLQRARRPHQLHWNYEQACRNTRNRTPPHPQTARRMGKSSRHKTLGATIRAGCRSISIHQLCRQQRTWR